MKVVPNKIQWKKWTLPTKLGYIAFWIGLISLLIMLVLQFTTDNVTKADIDNLPTKENLDSILAYQLKNLNLSNDIKYSQSYKGYSYQMMIYLDKQNINRRKFIFDAGEFQNKNRLSLYLDEEDNLCFRIIDETQEIYTLKVPPGPNTFRFNELMFLICEYAQMTSNPLMKIFVNLKDVGNQELPFNIKLAKDINLKKTNIGCDLNGENCLSFTISLYSNGRSTLSTKEKISYFNVAKHHLQSVNSEWSKHIRN